MNEVARATRIYQACVITNEHSFEEHKPMRTSREQVEVLMVYFLTTI